jgi:CHASE3 domain sensor protein
VKGMIRKAVFSMGVVAVLAFIVVNGYFAAKNIRSVKQDLRLSQEAALLQADISRLQLTLVNLETGQRGYLLTEDPAYLEPYTSGVEQLAAQFSSLRAKLADRPPDERAVVTELETVAQSIVTEADESIRWRQQGYRSRAFRIVKSNHGKELMDQARAHTASLLATEASRLAEYEQKTSTIMSKAFTATVTWNLGLLAVSALVFGLLWLFGRGLEGEVARGSFALREKSTQLESFTQTVSQDLPELLKQMQGSLENFLVQYEDYLPARGQEHAAQIREMAAQSNRLMTNSLEGRAVSTAA